MNELITGFTTLSNSELVGKADHIIASLSEEPGITYYPTPAPTLVVVKEGMDALNAAMALTDSKPATEQRDSLRPPLIQNLQLLAMNLETTTPGDRAKLAYTGYDLRKIAEHSHQPPAAPGGINVHATGTNGGIKIRCGANPNTNYYQFETTADPVNGPWSNPLTSTSSQKMMADGFTRGTDIYVRVRAANTNGDSPWSEIGSTLVT